MPEVSLPPIGLTALTTQSHEIPWGVETVNAPRIWNTATGEGIVVAVLDTGADTRHPDLKGSIIDGRNFTLDYGGNPFNYEDNQGHGTHCAGTIAAIQDGRGVVGVAPKVSLVIGKVLDQDGSGTYQSIINGIRWATEWRGPKGERVRIISMSLGGPDDHKPLHDAIKYAVSRDVAVVVAAGNEGDGFTHSDEYAYPGMYQEVIEVGAINMHRQLADFSNTNDAIDVIAPGVDVMSTIPGGSWARLSGTSMATPHVAGALALLLNMYETPENPIREPELYKLLIDHAVPQGIRKKGEGHGLVVLRPFDQTKTPPVEQEPTPTPVAPDPAPVPPSPTPTPKIRLSVGIHRVGKRYVVQVGPKHNTYWKAKKHADQLEDLLNTIDNVEVN